MNNKSMMRVPIVLSFFSMFLFHFVKGDIRDFVISDETDLKRFGGEDTEFSDDELDMYEYGSEMDMYDSCYDGEGADNYFPYEYMMSEDESDPNGLSVDSLHNMMAGSHISLSQIREFFKKIAKDPRYADLLEQGEGLEELYGTPSCQSESYTDVFINN